MIYRAFLLLTVIGTIIIFVFFMKSMGQLVTLATVVALFQHPSLPLLITWL